jgi:hypothetical protein
MASFIGMLVLKWTWLADLFGVAYHIERTGSMITFEYFVGVVAVAILGYVFYKAPIWCAAWFMFGPMIVTHIVHIVRFGIPQQLLLEVAVLAMLTIPYIVVAYAAAYLRRRSLGPDPAGKGI